MGSRRYGIKNRYFGPILLNLRFFVTASQAYASRLIRCLFATQAEHEYKIQIQIEIQRKNRN